VNTTIKSIIDRALAGKELKPGEIKTLFEVPLLSEEAFIIQFASRTMSEDTCDGQAEIHGQVGVNSGPCACNCMFCSFAASNRIFKEQQIESTEGILHQVMELVQQGANAIYLMATAQMDLTHYLDIGRAVRKVLYEDLPLIANVGDFDYQQALALKEAGFTGVYHALRLGEGQVTRIEPQKRRVSFQAAHKAGLLLGTCVEPVGPEHEVDELVEKTLITREAAPVFSGAARRISIPGTKFSDCGMISEVRAAHIMAVVRLAMGYGVPGNCTHEPSVIGAVAGANLLWAEAGSNPRDVVENTEKNRGFDTNRCRQIYTEAEWKVRAGASLYYKM
jgi:biotin synthase